MWPGEVAPSGTLELNGSSFDSEEYPQLYELLGTDVLPDFRGEFVRGWGHGRDVAGQSSRGILTAEDGSKVLGTVGVSATIYTPNTSMGSQFDSSGSETVGLGRNVGLGGSFAVPYGIIRPRNISVMFVIQAVPVFADTFEERVCLALEKIAEGVYHEEDAGEKKPLAKTIALLLAGLHINYPGGE